MLITLSSVLNKDMYTRSGGKWNLKTTLNIQYVVLKKTKIQDVNRF